jgi:glycosyltransferase involved in cell wall biosynthesis
MEAEVELSVIVPTHNRADALEKTLDHLKDQVFGQPWEVIVVNNNCSDNTDEVVARYQGFFPVPLILAHEKKPGASAARNKGAALAKGRYLLFMDNDVLMPADTLARHYRNLEQHPGAWFVAHAENMPEQKNTHFGKFRSSLEQPVDTQIRETTMITGQNVSLPRSQFEELGGFDEKFHVASGEDRELALRAIRKGIKIYFDPSIVVLHNDWAGSSIKDYCNRQRIYTLTEPFFWQKYGNETPRLRMVKENLPPSLKRDGIRLFAWKNMKMIFGSKLGQATLITTAGLFEKILPKPVILWKLYRMAISGAIYKGFNEGLKVFNVDTGSLAKNLPK